jgi:hypothetical protein
MASGSPGWPDYQSYLVQSWGYPIFEGCWNAWGRATNIVYGTNPPYYITDFFGFYPKFAGQTAVTTAQATQGLPLLTGVNTASLAVGQYVATTAAIPDGTTIAQINAAGGNGEITLSQPLNATGPIQLTAYVGPPLVPLPVIMAYIALATASLVQARWCDTWALGIALYVAHFCTIYLRSEGNCSSTRGQAATAGLKSGITVGLTAGGVSQTLKAVPGIDDWAEWAETIYGARLVTFAQSIGAGPVLIY